jgi:hypothetical protein
VIWDSGFALTARPGMTASHKRADGLPENRVALFGVMFYTSGRRIYKARPAPFR